MRIAQIFREDTTIKKIVAIIPGGFHPFHEGHKSLYNWAVEEFGVKNVYVAATNDTSTRPFPFESKVKLAQMAGVPKERFIQVKSPFNAMSYKEILDDPENTALVFVRSEKDKEEQPLPDQIRKKDGQMGYLVSYTGKENLQPSSVHGFMAYGPTVKFKFGNLQISSATGIRNAWPTFNDKEKLEAVRAMYPNIDPKYPKAELDRAIGNTSVAPEPVDRKPKPVDKKPDEKVDEAFDPNKLMVVINMEGDTREYDLTGRFQGDTRSQIKQANEFFQDFLKKKRIPAYSYQIHYQGAVQRVNATGQDIPDTPELDDIANQFKQRMKQ